jgi:hypothetical protein
MAADLENLWMITCDLNQDLGEVVPLILGRTARLACRTRSRRPKDSELLNKGNVLKGTITSPLSPSFGLCPYIEDLFVRSDPMFFLGARQFSSLADPHNTCDHALYNMLPAFMLITFIVFVNLICVFK